MEKDWINQIIGLLIVLFIFLFPILQSFLFKKKKANQEMKAVEEEQEELNFDAAETLERNQPENLGRKPQHVEKPKHNFLPPRKNFIEKEPIKKKEIHFQESSLEKLLKNRSSLQKMVILSEIFRVPKNKNGS